METRFQRLDGLTSQRANDLDEQIRRVTQLCSDLGDDLRDAKGQTSKELERIPEQVREVERRLLEKFPPIAASVVKTEEDLRRAIDAVHAAVGPRVESAERAAAERVERLQGALDLRALESAAAQRAELVEHRDRQQEKTAVVAKSVEVAESRARESVQALKDELAAAQTSIQSSAQVQ